jgi:hypothetical protein
MDDDETKRDGITILVYNETHNDIYNCRDIIR